MSETRSNPNLKIFSIGIFVLALDQITKVLIQRFLVFGEERVIFDGFFRLVHWGNTGAAWSMFKDNNTVLTIVAVVAVIALFLNRHHFEVHRPLGQVAMGLMMGGIIGNLIDRFRMNHVIDFLYFYTYQRGGGEIGFPAFNVADSAICTGVGLLLILSWHRENEDTKAAIRES
ncbi:MAG: signal peptidase II [Verrucomicrobia bacterium]|nr:signal peptidase II [Verrucomicrobiota bacterium]